MFIYLITNLTNGKKYVGQTILDPPIQRWQGHLKIVKIEPHKNDMAITRAIRKYGTENFTFEIIKTLRKGSTQDRLNKAECLMIKKYNTLRTGYNTKEGGSNGKHSEKTKNKIRLAKKGVPLGYKRKSSPLSEEHKLAMRGPRGSMSETTKLNMSKAQTGLRKSDAHKLALSKSAMGILRGPRGPLSEAHRLAISKGLKKFYSEQLAVYNRP